MWTDLKIGRKQMFFCTPEYYICAAPDETFMALTYYIKSYLM